MGGGPWRSTRPCQPLAVVAKLSASGVALSGSTKCLVMDRSAAIHAPACANVLCLGPRGNRKLFSHSGSPDRMPSFRRPSCAHLCVLAKRCSRFARNKYPGGDHVFCFTPRRELQVPLGRVHRSTSQASLLVRGMSIACNSCRCWLLMVQANTPRGMPLLCFRTRTRAERVQRWL